jgi:hypothetical protein
LVGGFERIKKTYGQAVGEKRGAVFLSFGIVSAQSQGSLNLLLRQSLAKTQKSSLRMATVFLYTL